MITKLYNAKHEHVADVENINVHAYFVQGVERTQLAHIERRLTYEELKEFKTSFELYTARELTDDQTSIFDFIE